MNNCDLISREALKEDLAKEIKTNDMGLWLKILLVIDNAPTVKSDAQDFKSEIIRMVNMGVYPEAIIEWVREQM